VSIARPDTKQSTVGAEAEAERRRAHIGYTTVLTNVAGPRSRLPKHAPLMPRFRYATLVQALSWKRRVSRMNQLEINTVAHDTFPWATAHTQAASSLRRCAEPVRAHSHATSTSHRLCYVSAVAWQGSVHCPTSSQACKAGVSSRCTTKSAISPWQRGQVGSSISIQHTYVSRSAMERTQAPAPIRCPPNAVAHPEPSSYKVHDSKAGCSC
jgi:hypothetical protein